MQKEKKLSTEPYKGTRDFYPEDFAQLHYLIGTMSKVAERFGYVEYSASVLEPAELYRAKSGEEIVNEQTYTFTDRGDREVTLRPEMTPTVARMIAGKRRELPYPLRWYSIPNIFRYEQPQRGRLREHWQLNVDLFGAPGVEADLEVITLAVHILKEFGAKEKDYEVRINDRRLSSALFEHMGFDTPIIQKIFKLADKKDKMRADVFEGALVELVGENAAQLTALWSAKDTAEAVAALPSSLQKHPVIASVEEILLGLAALGIGNAVFKPSLARGFDYYTGTVFEIFDTNPENRRSIFGGGRYDNLLEIFGEQSVPAVGWAMGDVTIRDFLEIRGLLPSYRSPIDLYICRVEGVSPDFVNQTAEKLRSDGLNVAVDFGERKVGTQIEAAAKQKIPFIVCLGPDEMKTERVKVKELESGTETEMSVEDISPSIKARRREK